MDAWACHLCATRNLGSGEIVQRCKLCKVPRRNVFGENNAALGVRPISRASSETKYVDGQISGSTSSESQDISRASGIQYHEPSSGPVPIQPRNNATGNSPTLMRAASVLEDLVGDLQDSKQESERRRETHEKELTRLRTMLDKVRASRLAVLEARSSSEQASGSPTKFASSYDERRLSSSSSSSEEEDGDAGAFGYSRSGNWSDDSSDDEETSQPTPSNANHGAAPEDDNDSLSDFEISSMPRGEASKSDSSSHNSSSDDDGDTLGYAEDTNTAIPRVSASKHSPSDQVAHEPSTSSSPSSSSASSSDYSSSSSSNDSSTTESSASASSFSAAGFSPVSLLKSSRWSPSQQPAAPISRPPYAPRLSMRSDDDDEQDIDAHILAASPSAAPSFNGGYAGMDFEGGPDGAASRSFGAAVNLTTDSADEFAYVAEGGDEDDDYSSPGRVVTDSLYRRYETLGTPQGDSPRHAKAQRSGLAFAKDARLRQMSHNSRPAPSDPHHHRRHASSAAATSPEVASPTSPYNDSSSLDSATTPMSSSSMHLPGNTDTSAAASAAASAAEAAEAAAIRQAHVAAAAAARRYDAVLAAETAAQEAEAAAVEAEAARQRVGARAAERAKALAVEHERLSAASAAADLALAVELEVEEQAHALARNYALEAQVAVDRQVAEERLYSGSADEDSDDVRANGDVDDDDDDGAETSFMPPYDAQSPHNSSLDGPPPSSTPPLSPPRHTTTAAFPPDVTASSSTHPHVSPPPPAAVPAPQPLSAQRPRAGSAASSSSGKAPSHGQRQPVHLASAQEASAARAAMLSRAGSQGRPENYGNNKTTTTTTNGIGRSQGRMQTRFSRDHSSHDDVRGESEARVLGELSYIDMAAAMTGGRGDKPTTTTTKASSRPSLLFARQRLGSGERPSSNGGSLDAQKQPGLGGFSSSQSSNKVKGGIGHLASMESASSRHTVGMGARRLAGGGRFMSFSSGDVRGGGGSLERPPQRQPQRHISFEDMTVGGVGSAHGTNEGGERNRNNETQDSTIEDSWAADGVGPFAPGGYRRDSDSDSGSNSPNGSVSRGLNQQQQQQPGLPNMIGASKTLTRRLDLSRLDSLRSASLSRAGMDASNSTTPRSGGTPLRGSRAAISSTASSVGRGSSPGALRGGSMGRHASGGFGGGFGRSSVKNPPSTRDVASSSRSRPASPPPRTEVHAPPAPREVSYLDLIGAVEATGPRQSSSEQRPPRSRPPITSGERSPIVARSHTGAAAPFSPDFTSMEPSPSHPRAVSQKRQGVAARAAAAAAKHAARLKKAAFPASNTTARNNNFNNPNAAAVTAPRAGPGHFLSYRDRVAQQQSNSQSRSNTPARGTPTPQHLGSNPHSPYRHSSGKGSGGGRGTSTSRALDDRDYDYGDEAAGGDDNMAEGDALAEEALRSALVGLLGLHGSNSSPDSGYLPPHAGSSGKAHRRSLSNEKHSLNAPVADLATAAADSNYSTSHSDPLRSSVSMPPQRRSISPPREPLGSYQFLLHKLKGSSKGKQAHSPSWHDAYLPPPNRKLQRPWAK